ncbi:MAG: hypothetical protein J2P35_24565, partial [Actinobacteria bacterium]|nr:hypothetical protein [Actinomycetota bacterium]
RGSRGWRGWRPVRRAALGALAAALVAVVVLVATPQGRAVISHVLRFAGIELRQQPVPAPAPRSRPSLPGEGRLPLAQARRQVSFPIRVPAALGPPDQVIVSDRGRVASLVYRRTPYGQVRMDEYAGHLDQLYFEKFVHLGNVTEVRVDGARALWVKGPQELLYITRDGRPAAASARFTTGNTLIWGTRRVALRLEGGFGKRAALAIADSAH